jgi:hypothetical protein
LLPTVKKIKNQSVRNLRINKDFKIIIKQTIIKTKIMKKLLLALSICFVSIAVNAQTTGWTTNVQGCFCCGDFYNLPTQPHIEGPVTLDCAGGGKYCTDACPTATFNWSVSPSAPFTGQNTKCITLGSPLTPGAYTITITISCGNKKVSNSIVVKVTGVQNCTPLFTATFTPQPDGISLNINTVPVTLGGAEHYWGIQYNGTYPNCLPCVSIPFANFSNAYANGIFGATVSASGVFTPIGQGTGKTPGPSLYGINYTGFPINSCFKITHYINCCGIWYKQTLCYTATTNLKVVPGTPINPNVTKSEIEKVEWKDLPKELQIKTSEIKD